MRTTTVLFFIVALVLGDSVYAQTTVRGFVKAAENEQGLVGATVVERGKFSGSVTDDHGAFSITTSTPLPLRLLVSFVGYESQEIMVTDTTNVFTILLEESVLLGNEIVITAAREPQRITDAPISISRISAEALADAPTADGWDLLSTAKGVEYNRKGVGVVDFNIRGFNAAFNARNLLMVDGRLSNLIAVGLPYLQLTSATKEDIDQIEIALGPSSALYGFGASNGLVNIKTKDPCEEPGTSVVLGGGSRSQQNIAIRHAGRVGENSGYKVTASHASGRPFDYSDSAYYSVVPGIPPTVGDGIAEIDVRDNFAFDRVELGWYQGLKKDVDVIVSGGYALGKFTQTTSIGRNQFNGWENSFVHGRLISPRWYLSTYANRNRTINDDSRILSVLTDNVASYRAFRDFGLHDLSDEEILSRAQETRLLTVNPDGSLLELPVNSKYEDGSSRINSEVQYNNRWGDLRIVTGLQWNLDHGDSKGTYLEQDNGASIAYMTTGGYVQSEYRFSGGLTLQAAGRVDHHSQWGTHFAPKWAASKTLGDGVLRWTYGRGIVAPTILQSRISFAGGRLLGNHSGFTVLDVDLASPTLETTTRTIAPLTVEKLDAFELGYKGRISSKLFVDISGFFNVHHDFITNGLTEIADPLNGRFVLERGGTPISQHQELIYSTGVQLQGTPLEPLVMAGVIPQDASTSAQIYFNFGSLQTFGSDVEIRWLPLKDFSAKLIYSYFDWSFDDTDPENDINGDGVAEEGVDIQINSPNHRVNMILTYGWNAFTFNASGRWVQQYNFYSGSTIAAETNTGLLYQGSPVIEDQVVAGTLNEGPLGGFFNADFSAAYRFPKTIVLSAGITNVFNAEVRDFVTSPAIRRLVNFQISARF